MRLNLPIIGEIRTGQDTKVKTPKPSKKKSVYEMGAGVVELGNKALTGDKSVSGKLLASFYGWVYANVSVLAEEVSKMEFELYSLGYSKGKPELKKIESHPLLDLLDKPNPFTTSSQFFYNTESHLELAGDTFYLLDKPTNPTQMFILQPDKVTVVPGDETDGYLIKQYEYKDQIDGKTKTVTYEPELIIQQKNPNPSNPYRGKSVVEAAALTIDTENLTRLFLKQFFENGAVSSFALASDQRITEEQVTRIEAQIRRKYAGVKNAFKALILGGGLKPVNIQQTGQQMQLLEMQTAIRDEIMAMFKNTKASLGIVEDVNRSNAEATLLGWKQSVIKPKMMRIVDTLNEFLVPKFGNNLILTFKDPVPENKVDDIEMLQKLVSGAQTQIMTVNEARAIIGLDPLKGEENDTVNNQKVPLFDNMPKSLRNIDLDRVLRKSGSREWLELQENMYAVAKAQAKKIIKRKNEAKKGYRNYTYDQALAYWEKQIQITEVVEAKFKQKIDLFLQHLEDKSIKNLHEAVPKSSKLKAFDLFDEEAEVKSGINLFTPLQTEVAELSGSQAYQLLNLSTLYIPSKDLKTEIEKNVRKFTKSFIETDKIKLTNILDEGIKEGKSIPQIEQAIRDQFGEFRKSQSQRIARTEVLRGSNAGQLDAFRESGVVEGKQWVTEMDGREDEECAALDGKIVSLNGSFFKSDYDSGEQPPLHPNCRCILVPVLSS